MSATPTNVWRYGEVRSNRMRRGERDSLATVSSLTLIYLIIKHRTQKITTPRLLTKLKLQTHQ